MTRERLGTGAAPEAVAQRLHTLGQRGVVCLRGQWAGGAAIVTSEPLFVLSDGADLWAALDLAVAIDGRDAEVVAGGWFGVLGYDGRHRLAFYDNVLRHVDGVWWHEVLQCASRADAMAHRRQLLEVLLRADQIAAPASIGAFGGPDRDAHVAAVERAVEHIRAGDIYQVNICTRLRARLDGTAADVFATAVQRIDPAFGAFIAGEDRAVVSMSPELFLERRGRDVRTAPIKGTRPRVADDDGGAELLRRSAKDAAENVMIVDLMRNDLGRVCTTGSIAVESLLDVEAHPGVWHLVSRVRGRLRDDVADGALLAATFPPGSVTGAPKLRATQIIATLEPEPRGAYTGAIGFVSPSWGVQFSVAIRTFEIAAGRIELGVGGGITADSVPMLEWHECLHKAAPLLGALGARIDGSVATGQVVASDAQRAGGLLETVLVLDARPVRLPEHLARLDRSHRELYGAGLPPQAAAEVRTAAASAGPGRSVLRLVVAPGRFDVSCTRAGVPPQPSQARTVPRPAGSWRHKWAERGSLDAAERAAGVPLFVAADAAVLETSRGNVFLLRPDGSLVTPPLRDDLLPGITRRALLDLAHDQGRRVELRTFGVEELLEAVAFWTSSLSGAVPIHSVDGVPTRTDDTAVHDLAAALIGGGATVR